MTRQGVLAMKRGGHARAGKEHAGKILDEVIELLGCYRKLATRALRPKAAVSAPHVPARPKHHDADTLRPPLKAIWLAALQPCGTPAKACLPGWLPASEGGP